MALYKPRQIIFEAWQWNYQPELKTKGVVSADLSGYYVRDKEGCKAYIHDGDYIIPLPGERYLVTCKEVFEKQNEVVSLIYGS